MNASEEPAVIEVRLAGGADAEALLDLKLALDRETPLMMYEPGERRADPRVVEVEILYRIEVANSTIIVAAQGSRLVGYVEATGGTFRRTNHLAIVTTGVRASHTGQGIGSQLFQALVDWADAVGVIRLELTVMEHNTPARALYEKFGFQSEGIRKCSMCIDGACVDEIAMVRIRPDFAGAEENG